MKLTSRVSNRSYYDYFPPIEHAPGDIWLDLPTHGLLQRMRASGLVVTPSCDLSNRKVSTITYVPIIPFREWIGCKDFLPEVLGAMSSLAESLAPAVTPDLISADSVDVYNDTLAAKVKQLEEGIASNSLSKSMRAPGERYLCGARHLRRVSLGEKADIRDLEMCLAKKRWEQIRTAVVRNSYRQDIYFLPSDSNEPDASPIAEHSVALFRYPLTTSVPILDAAQDVHISDWKAEISKLSQHEPIAQAFKDVKPLKCLRLMDRFLSDLLTKFVSLYSRLGSPDFSQESVSIMSAELGAST
jgi:hypothetical protein